jgi:hypothetical protein
MSTSEAIPVTPRPARMPATLKGLLAVLIALGAVGMTLGLLTDATRTWQAYLINFLFFAAFGTGGMMFVAAVGMTGGRWSREVKRVAEGLGAFLPVTVLLFLGLVPGLPKVLPWVKAPYGPAWWWNVPFLIARDAGAFVILAGLGMALLYYSLRVDLGAANEQGGGYDGPVHRFLTRGWKGLDVEEPRARGAIKVLAPIYGVCFAWLLSIVAIDLIMSLTPNWVSTLIGGYYFAGSFYIALAGLVLAVIWTRRQFGLEKRIRPRHLHDIAKLTMAFGVVTADFSYGQMLVIWYGNIPSETQFIIHRWSGTPFRLVGLAVLFGAFALPILAMLNRRLKESAAPMIAFAGIVLTAMWGLRYFEIVPAVSGNAGIPLGAIEILVTLGFLGLLGLTFVAFMYRVPPVAVRDPILDALEPGEG